MRTFNKRWHMAGPQQREYVPHGCYQSSTFRCRPHEYIGYNTAGAYCCPRPVTAPPQAPQPRTAGTVGCGRRRSTSPTPQMVRSVNAQVPQLSNLFTASRRHGKMAQRAVMNPGDNTGCPKSTPFKCYEEGGFIQCTKSLHDCIKRRGEAKCENAWPYPCHGQGRPGGPTITARPSRGGRRVKTRRGGGRRRRGSR